MRVASQWLYAVNQPLPIKLNTLLSELQGRGSDDAELANLRAAALGDWAGRLPNSPERNAKFAAAIAQAQRALKRDPDYLMAQFNLGYLCLEAGRSAEGEAALHQAVKRLTEPNVTADQVRGVYFPRRFETFDVHIERVWNENEPGGEAWCSGIQSLLLWRAMMTLGERALEQGRLREALDCARWAEAQMGEASTTQFLLGRAHRAVGQVEEAIAAYRRALERDPFLLAALGELAQLLMDLPRPHEALALLDEWAAILDGCPFYAPTRPEFDKLHAHARSLAAQPEANSRSPITRLLAFPNWRSTVQWQALIRAFAGQYKSSDPVLLMLRVEPGDGVRAEEILPALQTYLIHDLGLAPDALPNITLLNQPLGIQEHWKLFHIADALLIQNELPELLRDLATAAGVPIWTLEDLSLNRAA